MMVNERQSIEVDVLARPSSEFKSNRLEAMWWKPEQTTEVHYAVQNTADAQVRGKLTLAGSDGHAIKSLTLNMDPHQTRVYKLHELLGDASFTEKVGGVSIEYQGQPGDLRAQSFILRRSIGFSASLKRRSQGSRRFAVGRRGRSDRRRTNCGSAGVVFRPSAAAKRLC